MRYWGKLEIYNKKIAPRIQLRSISIMSTTPVSSKLYPQQATSVIIPVNVQPISTSRLYLRPLTVADAAAIFEIRRRQDVANYLWDHNPGA